MDSDNEKPPEVHVISSTDSPEFARLTRALTRSSIVGLDAEWKPLRAQQSGFPTVTLLQIACQLAPPFGLGLDSEEVFLLDLTLLPLPSIWELLRDVFVSPDILKLGFRFKQDLVYLSSTFSAQGCDPGLDEVKPYLDITSIYNQLQSKRPGRKAPKEIKSLATICREVLNISLSKELQCSDWSHRPLTEDQKLYAATDAHCLLQIFEVFRAKLVKEDKADDGSLELNSYNMKLGLKEILEKSEFGQRIITIKSCKASDIVRATASSEQCQRLTNGLVSCASTRGSLPMNETLLKIVNKYGERIILKESDHRRKNSKKKGKKRSLVNAVNRERNPNGYSDWQGPPIWDPSFGGDGYPKFLCDVMVEGLAKHLRCVGIDAAVPRSKRPEPRELLDQAYKERRVILTRDTKLLRHQDLVKNQIYRVKSLLKNEQLLEVIQTFELKISEDRLMSRCTKCNGRFIQKPLSTEEAIEAAKGFQRIPRCLFDKNLEFWQCMECCQLYWEGTQYHNAVQKFINVCKLND